MANPAPMTPQEFLAIFIELLLPHVRTTAAREALLSQAYGREQAGILPHVVYDGSAYQFATHCARLLLKQDASGRLFAPLLQMLRPQVGVTQQTLLDSLLGALPLDAGQTIALHEVVGIDGPERRRPGNETPPPFLVPQTPPQGVFGRAPLLNRIVAELALFDDTQVNVPPLALRGMGGIGKTTLLTALGRLSPVLDTYPDGVLWVSLGQSPVIRVLQDGWGKALGVDLVPEPSEAACRDRLRDVVYHRRCLLIVDDVWAPAHGRFFDIAGPASRQIYATRESVIAHELVTRTRTIRVDLLEPDPALALLDRLAPEAVTADLPAAQTLCAKLEYLPLGITLAGRMLANEADVPGRMTRLMHELIERREQALDLEEATGRLGDQSDAPASVREILDMSVSRLAPVDLERFAMAAVFGGDPLTWPLKAATAVWGCGVEEAEATTSRLIQRGLVERRGERYWMHALLAEYAEEKMEDLGL